MAGEGQNQDQQGHAAVSNPPLVPEGVPILDFGPYLDDGTSEEERSRLLDELASKLRSACEGVGFYFLAGAERLVPESLVKEMFGACAKFHDLDLAEKLQYDVRKSKAQTGYMPNYGDPDNPENSVEKGEGALKLMTSKSSFNAAFMIAGGRGLEKNPFPDQSLPEMRQVVRRYDQAMQDLATRMLPVYARALNLPPEELLKKFAKPLYSYRLTHYPETPKSLAGDMYGIQPHADVDLFTILAQNDVPGLSIRLTTGEWMPVPAIPRTFLVNTGEILHRLTNGRFLNTVHRVENRSGVERYAVVCFLNLDRNAVLEPILLDPATEQPKWPKFSAQDVFKEMVKNPVGLYQDDQKRSGGTAMTSKL